MKIGEAFYRMEPAEVVVIEAPAIQDSSPLCAETDCVDNATWIVCAVSVVEGALEHRVCSKHMGEVAQRFRNNVTEELLK